jgi:ankyrin repeat protein
LESIQKFSAKDINQQDQEGLTPLHWAVDRGHLDLVKYLISAGAAVNACDHDGQTPLCYAVLCEHTEIEKVLKSAGAK